MKKAAMEMIVSEEQVLNADILAQAKAKRLEAPEDAVFNYFQSFDGQQIRFARFPASRVDEPKGTIIFIPGRTEFIEKFIEDVHVFNALGFACAAMDLRGQGMSFRPHPDRNKHFVRSFEPHIADLKALFDKALTNKMPEPFILMGHSAGSHVILRFLHDHPEYAKSAITVAPMVRIHMGGTPYFIPKVIAWTMRHLGLGASYIPGHTEFKEGRWGWRKRITSDEERFQDEDFFVTNKDKRLAVGGATYKWFWEAMKSTDVLNKDGYAEGIKTPLLMLQAGEDSIVDNSAQNRFVERLPDAKLVVVEGAMHELLKETDEHRAKVWQAIAGFLGFKHTLEA